MSQRLRFALAMLGPKAIATLVVAISGASLLAGVELGVALFLQLFLQALGLFAANTHAPSWLMRLLPGPVHAAVALLTLGIVRSAAQVMVSQATTFALETTARRLRLLAVYELLLHPRRRYVPMSQLTLQFGEHFTKAGYFVYGLAALLGEATQAIVLAVVLFGLAARESALAMTGLVLTGIIVFALQRRSRAYAEQVPEELSSVAKGLERVARNLFLVRALRLEAQEHRRFRHSIDGYATHAVAAGLWGAMSGVAAPFAGMVLMVVVVVVSQRQFGTSPLVLLSFLYLFVRFIQVVSASVAQWSMCTQYGPQFDECIAFVERVGLDAMRAATAEDDAPVPLRSAQHPAPALRFEDVRYRYAEGPWIFEGLTCDVAPGEQFAVIGPSGAGKSTLLSLLLGVSTPTAGHVSIDGRTPDEYFAAGHVVGYVGAEAYLIAGTLADNLRYGLAPDRRPTDDELWDVLRAARLEDTVRAQPGGLEHPIREDGAGLSAGQKQRLCLARALLAKPGLLVLDEASANLDEATERELADMLAELKGKVTTIVVSHRAMFLKHADRILDLTAGTVSAAS